MHALDVTVIEKTIAHAGVLGALSKALRPTGYLGYWSQDQNALNEGLRLVELWADLTILNQDQFEALFKLYKDLKLSFSSQFQQDLHQLEKLKLIHFNTTLKDIPILGKHSTKEWLARPSEMDEVVAKGTLECLQYFMSKAHLISYHDFISFLYQRALLWKSKVPAII